MNESQLGTIEQIEQFLSASAVVTFTPHGDDVERYAHICQVLKRFDYYRRNRKDRGILLRYLQHTSGYSRARITRLVKLWYCNRLASVPLVKRYRAPAAPFARKYTPIDIALLVEMDKAHEDTCGPAIIHLLKRAYHEYGDAGYERLPSGRTMATRPELGLRKEWTRSRNRISVLMLVRSFTALAPRLARTAE